mmetsp:Transcript_31212/g.64716  ORF Transcript_31212/g.64716 Transcript_31212/m.64716 type:complete len:207 (+) Transcript_31212:679-1299(+)
MPASVRAGSEATPTALAKGTTGNTPKSRYRYVSFTNHLNPAVPRDMATTPLKPTRHPTPRRNPLPDSNSPSSTFRSTITTTTTTTTTGKRSAMETKRVPRRSLMELTMSPRSAGEWGAESIPEESGRRLAREEAVWTTTAKWERKVRQRDVPKRRLRLTEPPTTISPAWPVSVSEWKEEEEEETRYPPSDRRVTSTGNILLPIIPS